MRLNDWQLTFERYLLGHSATVSPELGASLVGGPTLAVDTGLAIYHNAYQARLQEVLRGDYPTIWHWLGDDEFEQLAAAYIRQCPSTHYSLRWLGKSFEGFIHQHLAPEQGAALAELAALEWAFTLAFDAPPGTPLTLQDMANLPPEDWPTLRFCRSPGVHLLTCRFNSLALWRAVKDKTEFFRSAALDRPQLLVIWRGQMICQYRSVEPTEATALNRMIQEGWSFAEFCTELAVLHGEAASLQAATWLKQWIHDGWLQTSEELSIIKL
ncbi:putative DNA-binding domain-containing protein [Pseudomonas sp. NPDC087346]|uniref:HvfC/BufC family peptide modification chaperone n=1 Tax=Pseudomonas sp. NPDC087346 TaxID=3364438 RepID=UPI0037F1B9E7